jgi:uncharacterized protein involved in outer membrane biogenesis
MRIRTLLITLVGLFLVIAIAVAAMFGKVDSFRPKIQAELQQKLNRPVTIGHLGLRLLPLEIRVEGFKIGEAANFPQDRPFATADTVFVSAGLFSLLRGNPEVKSVELDKPQIELIRNAGGVWNYSSLTKGGSSSNGESQFSLDSLAINDGQVGYTDQMTHQARSVYDHIDLSVSDFAPNKKFGMNLGIHFPGQGKQTLEFKGKVGPLNTPTENSLPPIEGRLTVNEVSLDGINKFASGALPAGTDATATGEADINTLADVVSCKGNMKLENTTLNGSKMDYPITANYNLENDTKQKKLLIKSGDVELGATKFLASGTIDTAATPAILNVQLKTDNSSITELAKLAGGFGVGFNPAYKVVGNISADVAAKGAASSPQLSGKIIAKGLEASGGEIKQPVSVPEIDLSLSPDSIASNTFTARSGSTALAVAFTLLQYTTKNMGVDATVKTDGANVSELLNIAKTYGLEAASGVTGTGTLSLNVHVKGSVENASAMSYTGTANLANANISAPSLKKPLNVASVNAAFSQNSVDLTNLTATLGGTTVKGSLAAKNFAAPQLSFNLSADKIDTEELQNVTVPSSPSPAAKSKGAPKPSLLTLTTGTGTIAAGVIKADDIVLKDVSAKVQLNLGVITLSPLSAGVFGGKANGSLSADMRPAAALCAVKVNFAGVDANSLLSAVSSMKNTIEGSLAAETNVRFSLAQSNELARTLNGTIGFNLTNGVIKNVNLISEIEKAGKLLKGEGSEPTSAGTALKKFSGTLNIVNGVATTNNLTGALNAGTLTSSGTLNLVNQDVNMHMTANLGAKSGGGLGGLVGAVPVLVTGNMAHPTVTPDIAAMAKLKLGNLAGQSGVGGILGGILGGQQQQQNPGDAKTKQKPANPFGSLLDSLKKNQ